MGNTTNVLRCMYTNADCLTNKQDEFKSRLTVLKTEVFLKHFLNTISQESL